MNGALRAWIILGGGCLFVCAVFLAIAADSARIMKDPKPQIRKLWAMSIGVFILALALLGLGFFAPAVEAWLRTWPILFQ